MLQKVRDLENAHQAAEANTKKIAAENDLLNKEVRRLRHLEQIRSIPTFIHYPVTQHGNAGQSGNNFNGCYNCGEIGHYI